MNIAKNTAKRMLESIEQQLHQLASEQQSMNGNKGGSAQFKCGGRIKRHKMQTQGWVPPQLPGENRTPYWPDSLSAQNALDWISKPEIFAMGDNNQGNPNYTQRGPGYNTFDWAHQGYTPPQRDINPMMTGDYTPNPMSYGQQPVPMRDTLPYKKQWQMVPNAPTSNSPLKKVALDTFGMGPNGQSMAPSYDPSHINTSGINIPQLGNSPVSQGLQKANPLAGANGLNRPGNSGSAMDWMGLLPTAFNLGAGIFSGKAQHLNANQFQNPYEGQALAQMPSQYRIDPLLNEYKNAYANTIRNVNNQGNSRGERMANYGAAQNQYGQQVGGAYAEKFNQENQMATRRAMMMNEQGQQRARTNMGVQEMNDQNLAAARQNRMGYLGAATSGLQKYGLINRQMEGQQKAQDAWLWAIKNQPHFADWVLGGVDPNNLAGLYNRK